MRDRSIMLTVAITGLLCLVYSLEYWLLEYTPLLGLAIYTWGLLAFVFGVRDRDWETQKPR